MGFLHHQRLSTGPPLIPRLAGIFLVLEAVRGGWSDALRSVVAWIASESKRSGPIDGSDASFKIAQRISCTIHWENARAILKRALEQMGTHCRSLGMSVLAESEQA